MWGTGMSQMSGLLKMQHSMLLVVAMTFKHDFPQNKLLVIT